jgi:hypothetical protein
MKYQHCTDVEATLDQPVKHPDPRGPLEEGSCAAKMENLLAREENGQPWSLQNDRDLLKALQDLSGDIMGRMQNLEADLADLDLETISTAARGGNAAASFNSLCHSQYIEQVI